MNSKKVIMLSVLVVLLSAATIIYAAESASFIVNMFTAGLQGSLASSSSYQARSLLTPFQPGSSLAQSTSYGANIGFFNASIPAQGIAVVISSYRLYPKSAGPGSMIWLYISATNAQSLWAAITLPNGSSENITLTNNTNTYYVASLSGRYDVVFYAANSSSGMAATAADYFEISATPAAAPASGIGGGAGTVACSYVWECSPWSICSGGKQTRTCTIDIISGSAGTCKDLENKPEESMACSEALFDISIRLDNVNLTENETLAFDVNLTEKNVVENKDVQLTYLILDENRTEIFRQMETKAVEKNLSFRKTIDLKLVDGKYTLRVDILYGFQQKAYAEQTFRVKEKQIEIVPTKPAYIPELPYGIPYLYAIAAASVILLSALIVITLLAIRLKKKQKKKLKKRRKVKKKPRKGRKKARPKAKKAARKAARKARKRKAKVKARKAKERKRRGKGRSRRAAKRKAKGKARKK